MHTLLTMKYGEPRERVKSDLLRIIYNSLRQYAIQRREQIFHLTINQGPHKEAMGFRLGTIWDSCWKRTLSYNSLVRQIEYGLQRGYTDEKAIAAVTNAILSGMILKV